MDGDVQSLNLATYTEPGEPIYAEPLEAFILPDTPEKYLLLSLGNDGASISTSGGASDKGGVMWTVSISSVSSSEQLEEGVMDWTVFPSTGMLLPGQR